MWNCHSFGLRLSRYSLKGCRATCESGRWGLTPLCALRPCACFTTPALHPACVFLWNSNHLGSKNALPNKLIQDSKCEAKVEPILVPKMDLIRIQKWNHYWFHFLTTSAAWTVHAALVVKKIGSNGFHFWGPKMFQIQWIISKITQMHNISITARITITTHQMHDSQ